MTSFPVNTHRLDPYRADKFQVILDGRTVPGVSKVSPLRRTTDVVLWREGGFASHFVTAPGLTSFDPIILERGITHDPTFEQWAALSYSPLGDAAMSLKDFRKDVRINLLNRQGTVVLSYMVYRAWVAEYQALLELDANASEVAVEKIVLQHEGFERDTRVAEPAET